MPTPDLDIGVVYTYERQWMPRLLSSLRDSGDGISMRLLLIDNDSDGIHPWLPYFPQTTVLVNSRRLGYAVNLNRILDASTARYALLLNTDLYVDPDAQCLAQMVRFMDQHPGCGLAGCRVYHEDRQYAHPARRFQTIPTILARRFGLTRLMPGVVRDYLYQDQPLDEPLECDWLSGCFLLVRREAYHEVGGFDSGFAKYFEDVDFCLRIARAGWQVMLNPATYCYHLEARSSKRVFSADALTHAKSYLRFLRKWGFSPRRHIVRAHPTRRAA